eukprot:733470-Amphidinium_carterae.1
MSHDDTKIKKQQSSDVRTTDTTVKKDRGCGNSLGDARDYLFSLANGEVGCSRPCTYLLLGLSSLSLIAFLVLLL